MWYNAPLTCATGPSTQLVPHHCQFTLVNDQATAVLTERDENFRGAKTLLLFASCTSNNRYHLFSSFSLFTLGSKTVVDIYTTSRDNNFLVPDVQTQVDLFVFFGVNQDVFFLNFYYR